MRRANQTMAERSTAADGDVSPDDDEIPDYVLAYLQTDEGQRGENIPDHVMEYIQKRAVQLDRQVQPSVCGEASETQKDVHTDEDVQQRATESPVEDDGAQIDQVESPLMAASAADGTLTEMAAVSSAVDEGTGLSDETNDLDQVVTEADSDECQVTNETVRPEPEGAAANEEESKPVAKKSKIFDLRSISLPHLPEMPSIANIKLFT